MYYTRPDIDAFGWDLQELPKNDGSYTFNARTSDDRPVWFRYRGGWLQVAIGDIGEKDAKWDQIILKTAIGPPHHMGIHAEQICDILGITVQGTRVVVPEEKLAKTHMNQAVLDWSGRVTYWKSSHAITPWDIQDLVEDLKRAFPDVVLLQLGWVDENYKAARYREVNFWLESDAHMIIGLQGDRSKISTLLSCNNIKGTEYDDGKLPFKHIIHISQDYRPGNQPGKELVNRAGGIDLNLDFNVTSQGICHVSTEFMTNSPTGQEFIRNFQSVLERQFCKGRAYIDLETNQILKMDKDGGSYSRRLNKWCLEKFNRYLYVNVEMPSTDTDLEDSRLFSGDKKLFYGVRPLTGPHLISIIEPAEAGDVEAQLKLGDMYSKAFLGVGQNHRESYFWLSLALKSCNNETAKTLLDWVTQRLTQEEIFVLNKRIEGWIPKKSRSH